MQSADANQSLPVATLANNDCEGDTSAMVPVKPRAIFEYQTQHFGFSPKSFTDSVHNELLSAWVQAVDDEVMPRLEKAIVRLSPEAIERLRLRIASNLMRSGRVVKLMEKMEAYLQLYVFRIPDTVTLREDQIQLEPRKPNPFDLLEETDDMQKEIIQLRAVLEIRRRQRRNVDAAIAIHRGILEMMKDTPIDKEENDEPMDGE